MKTKVINPYKVKGEGQAYVKIRLSDDGRLSLSGVVGPTRDGNCKGSCGQIAMSFDPETVTPNTGWDNELINQLVEVWKEWYLNDLTPGTPAQEKAIKVWLSLGNKYEYDAACEFLKSIDLYADPQVPAHLHSRTRLVDGKELTGYFYGSAWLKREVPQEVIDFLFNLPATKVKPAWV